MSFPKPKTGPVGYYCPSCRCKHLRNSRIGNLHKAYIDAYREARRQS